MKKIYSFIFCLMTGITTVFAQGTNTVVFTDGNGGEAFADGATIVRDHIEGDDFEGYSISSDLFIKNTGSTTVPISVKMEPETLPSGGIKLCFPSTCLTYYATTETATGPIKAGESKDLQSEWVNIEGYSQCKVKYTIQHMTFQGVVNGQPTYSATPGASITVIYNYADPAGIDGVEADKEVLSEVYYNVLGHQLRTPKGLCIKKTVYVDGTQKCVKMVVK